MIEKTVSGYMAYVDKETKALSQKYNILSYNGPCNTLGESELEGMLGKFMFLAKFFGEFVGVDFETYKKKFPGETWIDSFDDWISSNCDLEAFAMEAAEILGEYPLREETHNNRTIYFPKESLIKKMLKGTSFVPLDSKEEIQDHKIL